MSRSLRAGTEGAQWSVDPPEERLDECEGQSDRTEKPRKWRLKAGDDDQLDLERVEWAL